jgi:hypothetical protein
MDFKVRGAEESHPTTSVLSYEGSGLEGRKIGQI